MQRDRLWLFNGHCLIVATDSMGTNIIGGELPKGVLKAALDAAWKYLRVIDSEMLHYALFEGSQRVYCVVKVYVRLSIDGKTVETTALADGSSGDLDVESLVRYVETRALKRAIGRALEVHCMSWDYGNHERGEQVCRDIIAGSRDVNKICYIRFK